MHTDHYDQNVHTDHFEHTMHTEPYDHFEIHFEIDNMAQNPPHERTMSELTALEFTYDSLCIQYLEEKVPYVLKTGLIYLLS